MQEAEVGPENGPAHPPLTRTPHPALEQPWPHQHLLTGPHCWQETWAPQQPWEWPCCPIPPCVPPSPASHPGPALPTALLSQPFLWLNPLLLRTGHPCKPLLEPGVLWGDNGQEMVAWSSGHPTACRGLRTRTQPSLGQGQGGGLRWGQRWVCIPINAHVSSDQNNNGVHDPWGTA